jgi:hypothetical protein
LHRDGLELVIGRDLADAWGEAPMGGGVNVGVGGWSVNMTVYSLGP